MALKTKIFLFSVSLILVTVFVSFLIFNWRFSERIQDSIRSNLFETEEVFNQIFTFREKLLTSFSHNISSSPRLIAALDNPGDNEETIRQLLSDFSKIDKETDLMAVLNENGTMAGMWSRGDSFDPGMYKDIIEANSMAMTTVSGYWTVDSKLIQVATSPIYKGNTLTGIMIVGDIIDDEHSQILNELTSSNVSFFKNGVVLSSSFDVLKKKIDLINEIKRYSDNPASMEFKEEKLKDLINLNLTDAEHVAKVGDLPGNSEIMYVLSRDMETETAILTDLRLILFILGAFAVVLVFVVSLFASHKLTRPLKDLTEVAVAISEGNYDKKLMKDFQQKGSKDEIYSLAQNFERMRLDIKTNIGQIRTLNKELNGKNSELITALDDLEKAQDELVKTERMSAVGGMASTIIHDFKSPMTVIKGLSQIMAFDDNISEKSKVQLLKITAAVDRMNQMTHEVLEFVKGKINLDLEHAKISELVGALFTYMDEDLKANSIRVDENISFDPVLTLDVEKFRRVMENIIRNSIEACESGSTISVCTEKTNSGISIMLRDDGPGIPKDIIETLFEPFVTKGKKTGTGLGLAIVKKVIEEHKGTIEVKSELGKGTEFLITLPVVA